MIPFFLLYVYLAIASFCCFRLKSISLKRAIFFITSIYIWLFISLRNISVGTDTITYVQFFSNPNFYYHGKPTDVMFEYLGRLLRSLGRSKEFFIFSTGTFSFFGIFYLIRNISPNKIFSVVLFSIVGTTSMFFFLYLSMIRQACAMSLFFFSLIYFFEKKNWQKYLGLVLYLMSILMHGSAVFALPFLLIISIYRIDNKIIWAAGFVISYLYAVNPWFSTTELIKIAYPIVSSFLSRDYSHYMQLSFGYIPAKGFFNMDLLPFMIFGFYGLRFLTTEDLHKWYVQLFMFSIILNNVLSDNYMWPRLVLYFSIFSIIVIPYIYDRLFGIYKYSFATFIFTYYPYKIFRQLLHQASNHALGNIVIPYKIFF